jgi:hypothetical protein
MKFVLKMRITNIYISWFFQYFIAILTHQEINWANRPERQIAPLSPNRAFPFWKKIRTKKSNDGLGVGLGGMLTLDKC